MKSDIINDEMGAMSEIFTDFCAHLHENRQKGTSKKEWALRYEVRIATMQAMLEMSIKVTDKTRQENVNILRLAVLDSLLSAARKLMVPARPDGGQN